MPKISKKDNRIIIVNNIDNCGIEKRRMEGINISSGKYLIFIDSDNYLLNKGIIQKLYKKLIETDVDYIDIGFLKVL